MKIKSLKKNGFVTFSYPENLRKKVEETVVSWKKFCDLPIWVKQNLPYSNGADGVGYEIKDGSGNRGDRKENFDVTTGGKEWLEKNIDEIKNPTALKFVKQATELVTFLKPSIMNFAKQSEKAFTLKGFEKEVEESEKAFFIRFIHYFGDRLVGEEIATAHTDQSGFTFHLFESEEGFQCLDYSNRWTDIPITNGSTVIIPSMQMQLRSNGALKATCHRVVATSKTVKTGRYSAVCFIQLKHTPKYNKVKYGRLQEKEPGFNYSMTKEEFAKLFKK